MIWGHRKTSFWLNYGICPDCGTRHTPRHGAITCEKCGRSFDNTGLRFKPSSAPGGWAMAIAGGFVVAAVLVAGAMLIDRFF